MKKRYLQLFLVLCLAASLFAGCAPEAAAPAPGTGTGTTATPATPGAPPPPPGAEGVDMSERLPFVVVMGKQFDVPPNNPTERFIGDLFNLDIEFRLLPRGTDDYLNALMMIIASGDIPDMIQFDREAIVHTFYNEGLLHPMDELLEEFGQEILAIRPDPLWVQTTFDGRRMAAPITSRTVASVPIIRVDWLENVGLDIPTTLAEYEEVLRAFSEDDPDRTGGSPRTFGISGSNNRSTEVFAQAFVYTTVFPDSWVERDGQLVNGSVTDEVFDGLVIINRWFNNGWVDPEFPLYSRDRFQEILGTGTFGSYAWDPQRLDPAFDIGLAALYEQNPNALFVSWPPILNRYGNPGKLMYGDNRSGNFFGIYINSAAPERAMMILNYAASEEGYLRIRYGVEGVHYEFDETGQMRWIDGWEGIQRRTTEGMSIQYNNFLRREFEDRMANSTVWDALRMMNENMIPSAPFFATTPAVIEWNTLRLQLETEAFVSIMTASPGTDLRGLWDAYVHRWYNDVGGQAITDERNELWHAKRAAGTL